MTSRLTVEVCVFYNTEVRLIEIVGQQTKTETGLAQFIIEMRSICLLQHPPMVSLGAKGEITTLWRPNR